MSLTTISEIINNIFEYTPANEKIDIGFFGGEPLLEFELIKKIVNLIESHPSYNNSLVELDIISNGTIFNSEIAEFIAEHNITYCLSCDGPPHIQDKFRRYSNGKGSSATVEKTINMALSYLPLILVNAVFTPQTFKNLPDVVEYFSSFGITQIYMNPDYSAEWSKEDAELLQDIYDQISKQYIDFYLKGKPHYISFIDNKIMLFLKGGYEPIDRCSMGVGEFAFAPSGNIYPCERLIGSDDASKHCIGNISKGLSNVRSCNSAFIKNNINNECQTCSLSLYCMNKCGCSNYFSSGKYNRVSPFLCSSEKSAVNTALNTFKSLESKLGPAFVTHLFNTISANSCKGGSKNIPETAQVQIRELNP